MESTDARSEMAILTLTSESIEADIEAFNSRIESATQQLLALPTTTAGWQARKKLNATRNKLLTEIDHLQRIRQYAIDALTELTQGA
jgi:hypothetical protein